MSENKHNEMEQKELVKQLCEFIIYDAKDVDDNINDEDFDKHLKKKFPLINGDSFYNWKSLYFDLVDVLCILKHPQFESISSLLYQYIFGTGRTKEDFNRIKIMAKKLTENPYSIIEELNESSIE